MEGLTQDSIAEKLGISRLRVLRMLAASRQDGTVQIRVVSRLSECVGLERQIETAFGIGQAIVIPAPEDEQRLPALIGAAAGGYIADSLRHGMRVGLGWGNSLRSSLLHIPQRNVRDLTVVSLLGGLTRAAGVNPAEFAWRFADMLGAECYLLTAPRIPRCARIPASRKCSPRRVGSIWPWSAWATCRPDRPWPGSACCPGRSWPNWHGPGRSRTCCAASSIAPDRCWTTRSTGG
jgi:hypothetical protein